MPAKYYLKAPPQRYSFRFTWKRGFPHPFQLFLALLVLGLLSNHSCAAPEEKNDGLRWIDIQTLKVEGRAWDDTKVFYDRLPARAEGKVPAPVWGLSRDSSGMLVRFVTDATAIHARWSLTKSNLAMPHMAATGVSGLDLYVKWKGEWRWVAVGKPTAQTNDVAMLQHMEPGSHEFMLYLPLYNGVKQVEIGVTNGASVAPAGEWGGGTRKPILFYGTSILQGACASRPGMVHSAILGRKFQFPTINLGFSGNGRMEPALADLLSELDTSVYVLDCLPNMNAKMVSERVEPFVHTLRKAHPRTPILLVEDRFYSNGFIVPRQRMTNERNHAALKEAYDHLKKDGVGDLYYLAADKLLGDDGEALVDNSHPSDLGFMRQADAFSKVLGPLLKKAAREPQK